MTQSASPERGEFTEEIRARLEALAEFAHMATRDCPVVAPQNALAFAAELRALLSSHASLTAKIAEMERDHAEAFGGKVVMSWGAFSGKSFSPDIEGPVNFYERDFYPLSNFSAFSLDWDNWRFDTSEAAYHWEKFERGSVIRQRIRLAPSAHEAFKIAEANRAHRRPDWDEIKVDVMRRIIRAKADQHEYVRRKLLATGDRQLVEGSWRDVFWGAGPDGKGENMLGKLWMELRSELRTVAPDIPAQPPSPPNGPARVYIDRATAIIHDDGRDPRAEVRDSETGEVIFPAVRGPLRVIESPSPPEGGGEDDAARLSIGNHEGGRTFETSQYSRALVNEARAWLSHRPHQSTYTSYGLIERLADALSPSRAMPGVEEIAQIIRDKVKCDATGLAPVVASVFLVGFDEAAAAILALIQGNADGR